MTLRNIILILCFCLLTSYYAAPAPNFDEDGVRKVISAFVDSWNKHDPQAMASIWKDNGDLITPWGQLADNQSVIEKLFASQQKNLLGKTTMSQTINHVRFVTLDVAVVDATVNLDTGELSTEERSKILLEYHTVWVLARTNNKWEVTSSRAYVLLAPIVIYNPEKDVDSGSLPAAQPTAAPPPALPQPSAPTPAAPSPSAPKEKP